MNIQDLDWVEKMLSLSVQHEREAPVSIGWPVGTLVCNKINGRRGRIASCGDVVCVIEFNEGSRWSTTWPVVLRNYTKIG